MQIMIFSSNTTTTTDTIETTTIERKITTGDEAEEEITMAEEGVVDIMSTTMIMICLRSRVSGVIKLANSPLIVLTVN